MTLFLIGSSVPSALLTLKALEDPDLLIMLQRAAPLLGREGGMSEGFGKKRRKGKEGRRKRRKGKEGRKKEEEEKRKRNRLHKRHYGQRFPMPH